MRSRCVARRAPLGRAAPGGLSGGAGARAPRGAGPPRGAAAATDGSYAVPYAVLCDADAKLCGGEAERTLHLPRGVLLRVGHGALSCAEPRLPTLPR